MSDDQFQEHAIGHLLGELDVRLEIAFQEELARRGSPGQATLRELRETLGDLALAVAPAQPPNALRARVLWSVGAPVAPRDAPAAATRSFWIWATAALAAAVAVGLGVWAGRIAEERDALRAAVERLERRVAAADSLAAAADVLREDLALVEAQAGVARELGGTDALPGASARLYAADAGRALLLARGLRPLGRDRVYTLWVVDAGGQRPAGAFRPDAAGRGRLEMADPAFDAGAVLVVTEEAARGAERPSGPILLTTR
jgi:hypothetical protein